MNPQGKGPGGLFLFDPITKTLRHIATPSGSYEPTGLALLPSGDAILTDLPAANSPPGSPGPGPAMGRLYRVNIASGMNEILLQSPRLIAPMDVSADLHQNLIIADAGGILDLLNGFVPTGPGGLFKWVAETGDLLPLPISQHVLNPRRVEVSVFGTAVIGGFDVMVFPPGMDVPSRLNIPIPARSFRDLAWASDGRLLLLQDDVNRGEGVLFARDPWNQAHEIVRSPMLAGAAALSIVPPKNRRVGILKNAVARGVDEPVWVDLAISHITNLGALDIRIEYDSAQAAAGRPQLAPAAGNFLLTSHLAPGAVSLSLVIDDFVNPVDLPLLGQAVLVRIPFNLNNTLQDENRVPLIIHRASLAAYDNSANVAEIPVEPVDGAITVVRGLVGDINKDGDVNSGDAVLALQSGAGQRSLAPIQAARGDMNNDGRVNSGDALLILRTSTGLRPIEQF